MVKSPPANAGDTGSIPGPGRSHMPFKKIIIIISMIKMLKDLLRRQTKYMKRLRISSEHGSYKKITKEKS